MMKMKAAASVVLAVSLTAGCGKGTSGVSTGGNESKTGVIHTPAQQITVVHYALAEEDFNKTYGDPLRKKFPNVVLKYVVPAKGQKIQDLVPAGESMDIIFDSIGQVHANIYSLELQTDIMPLIQSKKYDLSKLEPTAVEAMKGIAKGGMYGLPVNLSPAGLFYNKDLFDKFGVGYPKDNMTWDEVYDLAKKMTRSEGGVQYLGYTTSSGHQALTNQFGLSFIDPISEKAVMNSDGWIKVMQSIVRFYQIPGYNLTSKDLAVASMRDMYAVEKRVAMYTNFSGVTDPEGMNWDVVTIPTYPDAPGIGVQPYPTYWHVTSNSKNKELAFDMIAWLTSEEFQVPFTRKGNATILNDPAIKQQFGQDTPTLKGKNVSALFPAKRPSPSYFSPYHSLAYSKFPAAFTQIASGQKDVVTALREADEQANKAIEVEKAARSGK
jgi:multiple sugar transport system substrate-binding protein